MPKTSDSSSAEQAVSEARRQETTSDLVTRLSRRAPGGRRVIEHAAIVAEGDDAAAILEWLADASWTPEAPMTTSARSGGGGLHGGRGAPAPQRGPRRYVSPPA